MFEELKVKAKPINEKDSIEWIEGFLSPINHGFTVIDKNLDQTRIDPDTVCRYAGEIDGVPVWEGDILEQSADIDEMGHDLCFYYRIVWDREEQRFVGREIYCGEEYGFSDLAGSQVLGNIVDIAENIRKNMSYDTKSFRPADQNGALFEGTFYFEGENFPIYVLRKPFCDTNFETQAAYKIFETMTVTSPRKLGQFLKYGPSESQQQSQAISR